MGGPSVLLLPFWPFGLSFFLSCSFSAFYVSLFLHVELLQLTSQSARSGRGCAQRLCSSAAARKPPARRQGQPEKTNQPAFQFHNVLLFLGGEGSLSQWLGLVVIPFWLSSKRHPLSHFLSGLAKQGCQTFLVATKMVLPKSLMSRNSGKEFSGVQFQKGVSSTNVVLGGRLSLRQRLGLVVWIWLGACP